MVAYPATVHSGDNKVFVIENDKFINSDVTIVTVSGSELNVSISGSSNTVKGSENNDYIEVAGSSSSILGNSMNDTIKSNGSNSKINGGSGDDSIISSGSNSSVQGGDGDDTIEVSGSNSTVTGGDGDDLIINKSANADVIVTDYSQNDDHDIIQIDVGTINNISVSGNDRILAFDTNKITLKDSADKPFRLRSTSTGDTISTSEASIIIEGTSLNDSINTSGSNVTINADNGANTITASGKSSSVVSGSGADKIHISNSNSTVNPGAGNDVVTLGGNSLYKYSSGDDIIYNFQNSDTIEVTDDIYNSLTNSNQKSKVSLNDSHVNLALGSDTITIRDAKSKTINIKNDSNMTGFVVAGDQTSDVTVIDYVLKTDQNFTPSSANDDNYVIVNADKTTLSTGKGNDTIELKHGENAQDDVIKYTEGNDKIIGFTSSDRITLESPSSGPATIGANYSSSNLKLYSGENLDTLTVANVTNESVRVYQGSNNPVLVAKSGVITLNGTANKSDVFYYAGGNQYISNYDTTSGSEDKIIVSTDVKVTAASVVGSDVVLNTGSGSLTIAGGKTKPINIEGYGSQVYGPDSIAVATSDDVTINTALNASVITVNASARTKEIYIVGNDKNNVILAPTVQSNLSHTINAGAGNDTLTGGHYSDVFIYTKGNDVITNYVGYAAWDSDTSVMAFNPTYAQSTTINKSIDAIVLGGGIDTGSYSINGNDVVFTIDKDNSLTVKNGRNKHIKFVSDTNTTTVISENVYRATSDVIVTNEDIATLYGSYKGTETNLGRVTIGSSVKYIPTVSADSSKTLIDANLEYNSDTSLYLLGNSAANSIIAGKKSNDTLYGGGNKADTLIGDESTVAGSSGKNVFAYKYGDGNDVIVNYHDSQGDIIYFLNTDTTIASSSLNTKTGDVSFVISRSNGTSKTTLRVVGGQDKRITFANSTDTTLISQVFGNKDVTISSSDLDTVNTKVNTNVKNITIDDARSNGVYIVGNSNANSIVGGKNAESTIQGGTGKDTLISGTKKTTFAFNKSDGTANLIQGFKFNEDEIKVLSGALTSTSTIKNSNDMWFKIGSTKVRVENAIGKKVTVEDSLGHRNTQTYGVSNLTLLDTDADNGSTVDTAANSLVVTLNAADVSNSVYLGGNAKANYIAAGKGLETIKTASGKDTVKVNTVNNNQRIIVTDYVAGTDKIELAKDVSIVGADTLAGGSQIGSNNTADTLIADSVILTLQGANNVQSTLAVQGTIITNKKNGKKTYKKISIIDDTNNITYAQAYGADSLQIANGDGDTIDVRGNNNVTTINAKSRSKVSYIIANDTKINNIIGGSKADTIVAGQLGGTLFGAGGADYLKAIDSTGVVSLSGGGGNDTLYAGKGKNTLSGGKGNDVFFYNITVNDTDEDVITDIGTGTNQIYLETGTKIVAVSTLNGSDIAVTLQGATSSNKKTIKLQNAVNKKVTIFDAKTQLSSRQVLANPTLAVVNADGDTIDASTDYNSSVTYINAKKRSKAVTLIGNANNNTLIGGSKNDIINSTKGGNNVLTGGKGDDIFVYGGGNDTITDYSLTKNNNDKIQISSGSLTSYSVSGKDVILNIGSHTLTVVNGKDKALQFLDSTGKALTTNVAGSDGIFNNFNELILTKKTSLSKVETGQSSLDSRVTLIDATNNNQAITILANNQASTIKGSKYADSITGGNGNDSIVTGKGKDVITLSKGYDTIADYGVGADTILIPKGVSLSTATYDGNDLILGASNGANVKVMNAINKKNVPQKITITENDITTSQVYGKTDITLAGSDGEIIDLTRAVNSNVTNVYANKLTAKNSVTVKMNSKGGSFVGGKSNDTVVLASSHSAFNITTSTGNDSVSGFKSGDTIKLANGHVSLKADQISATEYKLSVLNGSKKVVGTLTISGDASAFTTDTEVGKTTTNAKTKTTTTETNYFVKVGGQKAIYKTDIKTTEASFDERLNYLVDDDNYGSIDDLSEITADSKIDIDSTSLNFNENAIDKLNSVSTQLTSNKLEDK